MSNTIPLTAHDKAQADEVAFKRLKAELLQAFAAPEAAYKPLSAADVIARNCE